MSQNPQVVTHLTLNEGEWPTIVGPLDGLPDHQLFKDGVSIALEIIDKATSLEEARERLTKVFNAYEEIIFEARSKVIKSRLLLWREER